MANKTDSFYYENFIEAADFSCRAAQYLCRCLNEYDPVHLPQMLASMHAIEHEADLKKHEMSIALAKAFVTPIDREDLAELSQNIDDVTDTVEEILQFFYVNHIKLVTNEAKSFAEKILSCCQMMKNMLTELENFKKPEHIHQLAIEVNRAEEECDQFFLEASYSARNQFTQPLDVVAWREIYSFMENCADACEHVADCVETIVMKNT